MINKKRGLIFLVLLVFILFVVEVEAQTCEDFLCIEGEHQGNIFGSSATDNEGFKFFDVDSRSQLLDEVQIFKNNNMELVDYYTSFFNNSIDRSYRYYSNNFNFSNQEVLYSTNYYFDTRFSFFFIPNHSKNDLEGDYSFYIYSGSNEPSSDPFYYTLQEVPLSIYQIMLEDNVVWDIYKNLFLPSSPTEKTICDIFHRIGENLIGCDFEIKPGNVYFFTYGSSDNRDAGNGNQYFTAKKDGANFKNFKQFFEEDLQAIVFNDVLRPLSFTQEQNDTYLITNPHLSQELCEVYNGHWLNEIEYSTSSYNNGLRCCYGGSLGEQNYDMVCMVDGSYEWKEFSTYCEAPSSQEGANGAWLALSDPNYYANNVTDGCCGDDRERGCYLDQDIINNNYCNELYFNDGLCFDACHLINGECVLNLDYCDINNKITCEEKKHYSHDVCKWQESDLGNIIKTADNERLCLFENGLNGKWEFVQASDYNQKTKQLEINSNFKYDFYAVGNGIDKWFLCDAFNTNYFTKIDGEYLSQYEFPSYGDAGLVLTDLNYICAGYNFYKSDNSNESVTAVQSLFHKCYDKSFGRSLYEINSSETTGLQITSGILRHQINLNNITNLENVSQLSFFLKSDYKLNEMRFYNDQENLINLPVIKTQDISLNNMSRYIVNISDYNHNLNNVTRLFLYFDPVGNFALTMSNISLTFLDENYFCGVSGSDTAWINDLDNSTYGKSVCNAQPSFNWTGNYCCGDDTKFENYELYNDNEGACFMGIPVLNHSLVYNMSGKEEHKAFLYNGTSLIGCNISVDNYLDEIYSDFKKLNAIGGNFISLQNSTEDICNVNSNYVCGINNEWINRLNNVSGDNLYHNLDTSLNFSLRYSSSFESKQCCPGNSCWNGGQCVAHGNYSRGNVCIEGLWLNETSSRKYNPERNAYGHCASEMCYINNTNLDPMTLNGNEIYTLHYDNVSVDDKNKEGTCVSSHYYVDDAYCLDGIWRSRPQLIASTFLGFVQNKSILNYTLLCDNQTSALNMSYNYLENNNACVLSYYVNGEEKRLVGVSGNVTEILQHEIKNKDICNNQDINDCNENCNSFIYCGNDNQIDVYLNPHMNSLIIQRYENQDLGFWQTIINFIMDPINTIMRLLRGPDKPISFGRVGAVMLPDDVFDTFYIAQNYNKTIFGYVRNYDDSSSGGDSNNYIFVDYQNFTENICMKLYPLVFQTEISSENFRFFCEPYVNGSTTGFKIRTEKSGFNKSFEENLFNDLTSEIRITYQGDVEDFIYLEFNETPIKDKNFTVTLKNSTKGDLDINVGEWRLYGRDHQTWTWHQETGGLCSLDDDNNLNCKINELSKDYKLVVNHNNIKVEHVFNVVEYDSSVNSCNILPSNPYEGDILFANFTYKGFEEIEIEWYNNNVKIDSCTNQTYCDVFENDDYTINDNFNFTIKEKDSGNSLCSSTQVNFSYCGDNVVNSPYEQCDDDLNSNCTSFCTWKPVNCYGNFMLPCEAYTDENSCGGGCTWDGNVCEGTPICCKETSCDDNCNFGCTSGGLECPYGSISNNNITIDYWFSNNWNLDTFDLYYKVESDGHWDSLLTIEEEISEDGSYHHTGLYSSTTYYYNLSSSTNSFSKSIQCITLAESPNQEYLIGEIHTVEECGVLEGETFDVPPDEGKICKFEASVCPSGWVQYENWSTTLTKCGDPTSCDCECCDTEVTVGYEWSNPVEYPPPNNYYDSGYCNNPIWSGGTCTCGDCWSFAELCSPITTGIGCI